jgi:hypothetical protein
VIKERKRGGRVRQTDLACLQNSLISSHSLIRSKQEDTVSMRKRKRKMASDIGCCSSKFMSYVVIIIIIIIIIG